MSTNASFSKLCEPGKIGSVELKNRIVMAAMGTGYEGVDGEVPDDLVEWFARRARGGAALLIVTGAIVGQAIDPIRGLHRHLRADDARFVPELARIAEAIHANGAKAGIQLSPGAGAQATGQPWIPGTKAELVSPSGVPGVGRTGKPRALTTEEVERIPDLCGIGARNIKQAGFDLIEIHAHGGYLIAEFLSSYFNKRTDKYGGSLDNRCRLLLEIVEAMRKAVGPSVAVTVKYSIEDFLPGGWDVKQSQILAKKLEAAGVDAIDISSGAYGTKLQAAPPYFYPRGVFLPYAVAIKEVVKIPVIVGGRLNDPQLANKVLKDGKADFIAEGRALIADPDWPRKVTSGQVEEIRPCLSCNECRHFRHKLQGLRCSVNARVGKDVKYDSIQPAEVKKTVLVVGGGPAGMEASTVAAMRGHKVILCEKQQQLGGLMLLGGIHNEEITAFLRSKVAQIKRLPIEVRLRTEVTPALVEELKPDAVVIAAGGTFRTLEVPGIDRKNVFSAQDLLKLMNGIPVNKGILLRVSSLFLPVVWRVITASMVRGFLKTNFPVKKNVVAIGGQFPGCALSLLLVHMGKKVTVIEEADYFGDDMEEHTIAHLKMEVEEGKLKILTSTRVDEVNNKGVVVVDKKGNKTLHEADTVIKALELAPSVSDLGEKLKGKVKEVYTVGDAKSFRRIIEAVSDGYMVGCNL